MQVIVYASKQCGFCIKQKEFLLENGISFEERDIKKQIFFNEFKELGGFGTPFTVVKKDEEIISKVHGFNKDELSKILIQ